MPHAKCQKNKILWKQRFLGNKKWHRKKSVEGAFLHSSVQSNLRKCLIKEKAMSTRTEHSTWSLDEADSLENIDKEIQLVSTSTDSHSVSNQPEGNRSMGKEKTMSDSNPKSEPVARQSTLNIFQSKSYDNLQAIKFHTISGDIVQENMSYSSKTTVNCGSNDLSNHHSTKKTHDDQNKIKHGGKQKTGLMKSGVTAESSDKEDYLEQINKQLTKELDEKNAILSLLQENYERLLFKYAEAQNRIDELRIKFLAEKSEPKNLKQEFANNQTAHYYSEEYSKPPDVQCQKAVVTPFINLEEPHSPPGQNKNSTISRPSSLPLDNSLKFGERDLLKATTPTDSEGLSSIITSMSGHSKILNSLDEENQINKKSSVYKYKRNNFLLKENVLNDPFDKVKNWQNSLPPLEQIETPETTLYNVNNAYSSTGTNYKEISSPKIEKDYVFSDESCPLSWKEEVRYNDRCEENRIPPQSAPIGQFYSKKSSDDGEHFHENFGLKEKTQSQNNVPATSVIQRRHRRPPLLRCSSLPAYDYESIKSGHCKNGIYIPPLDLNNVTLSDDESYCQQDCYISKSNGATSSSLISSDPIDRSIQTPQSFSSCKATISEERVPRQTISKSTSITPDRSRAMDLTYTNHERKGNGHKTYPEECNECCSEKAVNRCNVCGELIPGDKSSRTFGSRSNSCESVHKRDVFLKETPTKKSKPPFKRSVSFNSCTSTPRYCSHEKQREYLAGLNQDSLENFDAYASNLKARSQVVIKALAAHVNNS